MDMEGFKTPPRCSTIGCSNGEGEGKCNKRVFRSALEVLAETASPELVRQGHPTLPNTAAPSKFTVTNTAAPPGPARPVRPTSGSLSTEANQSHWTPAMSGGVDAEEPSTLLFLSPSAMASGNERDVRRALFRKKKRNKKEPECSGDEKISDVPRAPRRSPGLNASDHSEFENDDEKCSGAAAASTLCGVDVTNANKNFFTKGEVQLRVAEALRSYERTRDAEEEAVLLEVSAEINALNQRYEKLLESKTAVVEERDALKRMLEQRAEINRAEKSAANHPGPSAGYDINERMKLEGIINHLKGENIQLVEQLEACEREKSEWRRRCLERESATNPMHKTSRPDGGVPCLMQSKTHCSKRATEQRATCTREECSYLESRVQSLEETVKKQSDDIRRKMHRIHMLEGEHATLGRNIKMLQRSLTESTRGYDVVRCGLEGCIQVCCGKSCGAKFEVLPGAAAEREGCLPAEKPATGPSTNGLGDELGLLFVDDKRCATMERSDKHCTTETGVKGMTAGFAARGEFFEQPPEAGTGWAGVEATGNLLGSQEQEQRKRSRGTVNEVSGPSMSGESILCMCKRLHQRQQGCERLVESLQKLLVQMQQEKRRQIRRFEARLAENAEADIFRYREACAASKAEVEVAMQEKQQLAAECEMHKSEAARLTRELEELRGIRHNEQTHKKCLIGNFESLQWEYTILQRQLQESQRECVELRSSKEVANAELGELQVQLTASIEKQRQQREEGERESKKLAMKVSSYGKKLKVAEEDCQKLRDENDTMTNRISTMEQQLRSLRAQQQRVSDGSQSKQILRLSMLVEELCESLRSDAALHAKRHAETEATITSLSNQNNALREDISRLRNSLVEARNEVEQQSRSERYILQTIISIQQGIEQCVQYDGYQSVSGVASNDQGSIPSVCDAKNGDTSRESGGAVDIDKLRHKIVVMWQRAAMELARLREIVSKGQHLEGTFMLSPATSPSHATEMDKFRLAEQLAYGTVDPSVTRRQLSSNSNSREMSAGVRQAAMSPYTPNRLSVHEGSPSPGLAAVSASNAAKLRLQGFDMFACSDCPKANLELKKNSPDGLSASPPSTGGVSRSKSAEVVLDGNISPAPQRLPARPLVS
uniref:WGS project CAEQ00000000 data, annotated contig 361 n=1 Tax=Trypanosoma congolense (strain IL3000) TaxID=1068625 RepID=F9WF89_TRYCI|nr:unnamed protein product [Trypanosoma congolense IL3000]